MSIVRYVNKKTGTVSLYESTSHYDPETKQSRPIRKYLGREDPITKELIPSSGRRGRKPKTDQPSVDASDSVTEALRFQIEELKNECDRKDKTIQSLERDKKKLIAAFQSVSEIIQRTMKAVDEQ